MVSPRPEVPPQRSAPPSRGRVAVRDPALAAAVTRCGYAAVSDPGDAAVVVATTVEEALEAEGRGVSALLHLGAPGAAEHLEAGGHVECAFTDGAGLCERLEWLESHGWRSPERAPTRVELAARLIEARAWLAAVREAERQAQVAHDEDVERRAQHERALEDHRDHLIARIAEMDERMRALDEARAAAQERLEAMLSSRLWRLLRPAHALGRRLRDLLGRGAR